MDRSAPEQIGVELPITVERHVVATFRWASWIPTPAHGDLVGGYYFRPEGEDLYLVGPVHPGPEVDPDDFDHEIREDEVRRLAEAVVRRVPQLSVRRSTAAGRACTTSVPTGSR